jgi:general secretion pathway protein F
MPDFLWKAAQADAQIIEGRLQASSLSQAMHQLRTQRLTPLQVVEVDAGRAASEIRIEQLPTELASGPAHKSKRVKSKSISQADILVMTNELSIMLKAGLPLDNALRVLIGMNAKPAMARMTQTILDDVKSGVPFSRALLRHPQQFGDFYVNMVRSGEAGGQLSAVLERLNEHLERLRALRESVVSAAIYPAILLTVAVLSVIAMLGFVVPQFESLFKEMGDALPAPTRVIMAIGHAFTDYGLLIGFGLFLAFWLLRFWLRSPAGHQWWQARALRLPLLGTLVLKYDLTLFARSLGTLLGNGVALLSALHIATQTVGNVNLRNALAAVIPKIKGGGKMVDALQASGIFEPLAINLIKVGEETGRMGPMLLELARIYNRDVETGIKRGLTLLEPLLILVLGMLIASIIVSIMLGILSVNDLAV